MNVIKRTMKGIGGLISSHAIYAVLCGSMWVAINPPVDPRLHSLAVVILVFFTILFTLLGLSSIITGTTMDNKMDEYEKYFLEPLDQMQRNIRRLAERAAASIVGDGEAKGDGLLKSRNKLAEQYKPRGPFYSLRMGYWMLWFIAYVALVGMGGYIKTAVWLGICEVLFMTGAHLLYTAQSRAADFKEKEQIDTVSSATSVPVSRIVRSV